MALVDAGFTALTRWLIVRGLRPSKRQVLKARRLLRQLRKLDN